MLPVWLVCDRIHQSLFRAPGRMDESVIFLYKKKLSKKKHIIFALKIEFHYIMQSIELACDSLESIPKYTRPSFLITPVDKLNVRELVQLYQFLYFFSF
jgi:hypothetical protein